MDRGAEDEKDESRQDQLNLGPMLGMALAAVMGTTLTVWVWHFSTAGSEPAHKTAKVGAAPRIAVLPFRSLSGNPDDKRVEEALTTGVIETLSRLKKLEIVPVKGDSEPEALGREMGAKVLIIGLLERRGGQLKIKVQLVSGLDGRQIWAGSFEGEETGIDPLAARISEMVAKYLTALLD